MIQNFIIIDGVPVPQEEIPEEKMQEISKELATRLAAGFDYVPVENEVASAK